MSWCIKSLGFPMTSQGFPITSLGSYVTSLCFSPGSEAQGLGPGGCSEKVCSVLYSGIALKILLNYQKFGETDLICLAYCPLAKWLNIMMNENNIKNIMITQSRDVF